MPTNEERREVAARLQNWESLRETFMESPICAALYVLNVEGYLDWRGVCELLADLIEPEPERTCRWKHIEGTWFMSECGERYDRVMPDNYCPNCGAKVIGD